MSNETTFEYTVDEDGVAKRADKFLSDVCELTRSRLQALIGQECVLLNGSVLKTASKKLELNDIISVRVPLAVKAQQLAEDIPLKVVYEDDDLLVIDKPAGLVVHPGAGNQAGTLVNALLHHCGDTLSGIGGVERPGIVHRLDKDTSGLMLVAKNDHAHQYLAAQLADRSLSRVYLALVLGTITPLKGSVERPIGRHKHNRLKMSVVGNALREARTYYKVIQEFGKACSLIECRLDTGRTHQIRVHMEALGHPLLGDPLYGAQRTAISSALRNKMSCGDYEAEIIDLILNFPRQFLHAFQIKFIHPRTEEEMFFEVDMPQDMSNVLNLLNKTK